MGVWYFGIIPSTIFAKPNIIAKHDIIAKKVASAPLTANRVNVKYLVGIMRSIDVRTISVQFT
jgi:hypothetical protein